MDKTVIEHKDYLPKGWTFDKINAILDNNDKLTKDITEIATAQSIAELKAKLIELIEKNPEYSTDDFSDLFNYLSNIPMPDTFIDKSSKADMRYYEDYKKSDDIDDLCDKFSKLNEKWYRGEEYFEKFWFSDNIYECQNFLKARAESQDTKALRFIFAPNYYAIANGLDLNHDLLSEMVYNTLYIEEPQNSEKATAGFPKCTDFELGNYENERFGHISLDNLSLDGYNGEIIADCGNFEVLLYNYISDKIQRPSGIDSYRNDKFEGSELEKVLKPFIKKLYIYNSKEDN